MIEMKKKLKIIQKKDIIIHIYSKNICKESQNRKRFFFNKSIMEVYYFKKSIIIFIIIIILDSINWNYLKDFTKKKISDKINI